MYIENKYQVITNKIEISKLKMKEIEEVSLCTY